MWLKKVIPKRFVPGLREVRREVRKNWGNFTAGERMLPDFIIIGAQRSGTTSLFYYLSKHPNIIPARKKEIHFFDHNFSKSLNWYRSHFPLEYWSLINKAYPGRESSAVTGESSPFYLLHPKVPKRIKKSLVHPQFLVILRDPIDRAYSHYQKHEESLSFAEAVKEENIRLEKQKKMIERNETSDWHYYAHYSYLKRGEYADQLERWFEIFNREQFLILFSECFFQQPQKTLNKVFDFFDLPRKKIQATKKYNEHSYPPMDEEVRKKNRGLLPPPQSKTTEATSAGTTLVVETNLAQTCQITYIYEKE